MRDWDVRIVGRVVVWGMRESRRGGRVTWKLSLSGSDGRRGDVVWM